MVRRQQIVQELAGWFRNAPCQDEEKDVQAGLRSIQGVVREAEAHGA